MHRTEGDNYVRDSLGRNMFSDTPPATCVEQEWLNTVQEEIANVVEWAGLQLLSQSNDTKDQLKEALRRVTSNYDIVISSQQMFNSIWERTAANVYQIKNGYKSVYLKYIVGGYKAYGTDSFLSGGDTWGELRTNSCYTITCEGATEINVGNSPSYLNVVSAFTKITNLDIVGLGTVASAVQYSFYIDAEGVCLLNCKTSGRISNTNFCGFYDNNNSQNNYYINCQISSISTTGGTIKVFYQCHNINNIFIFALNSSSGITTLFDTCRKINNIKIDSCVNTAEHIYAFHTCYNISNVEIDTLQHTGAVAAKNAIVFQSCEQIDTDSIRIASLSTNGTGYAANYIGNTFTGKNIHEITKAINYTILPTDEFDEMVVTCNTAAQYGMITITLLTGSQSNGQIQCIRHGDAQGLVKVMTQGGNKIRYKGTEVDYVLLYSPGHYLKYHWNTTDAVYEIDKLVSLMSRSWDNRSDEGDVHLGNGVNYDNGSGTSTKNSDWTGMVITEATSNFTAVVVEDTGGVGASGILYLYELKSGFTYWTNNRKLTASNGHNCDVNEATGTSKNIDYDLFHEFGVNANLFSCNLFYNSSASFTNAIQQHFQAESNAGGGFNGLQIYQISTNTIQLQTGANGLDYLATNGAHTEIISSDWFFIITLDFSC